MENPKRSGSWEMTRAKLFNMVSVGVIDEPLNQSYDVISTAAVIINLTASILMTYENIDARYHGALLLTEQITVLFFAVDYILRIITAQNLYPKETNGRAIRKYTLSFTGLIDLLSFLPYYLPVFFPAGAAAFRMFRVVRILRLFRINAYYDSLNVITEVISSKKQQLLSSVFIILILMLASSLCMYSLEHEAQPEIFANAFSGIWWSASTLLTVGYGDIYPITTAGKVLGIIITFLGVGMVAIPTGIISAGFVEKYAEFKKIGDIAAEHQIRFIDVSILEGDSWVGRQIHELALPSDMTVAAILRSGETIIPHQNTVIRPEDLIFIASETRVRTDSVDLKEIVLGPSHPWNGLKIKKLPIDRETFVVIIKRNGQLISPRSDLVLMEGDTIMLYSESKIHLPWEE